MVNNDQTPIVVAGASVLTMDPLIEDLSSGDVLIEAGTIGAVGAQVEVPNGATVIDATGMIVLPGLVDTHWHLWNSSFRSVIANLPERGYFPVKNTLAPHMTPEDTYHATRLGLAEGLVAGITTVNNWNHNVRSPADADAGLRAHQELGLRARFSYGNPDRHPPDLLMDLADIERVADEWIGSESEGLLHLGAALRGPVRTDPEICDREWAAVRDMGLPITMHCGGRRTETGRYCEIAEMESHGYLGPDFQIVHAVHATDEEIRILADTGTHLTLSPLTELRTMGIPPVGKFLDAGILTSLSIDTLASPTTADMFLQMRVTLSMEMARDPDTSLNARKVLEMATIDAARDLGLEDAIGSLTPGKRADLILVRATDINTVPSVDPISTVVFAATPANVDTVIVDGEVLVSGGKPLHADLDEIASGVAASLDRLLETSGFKFDPL